MLDVVIDTNVIISAIAFGGQPKRVVEHAVAGRIRNHISAYILGEIKEVLRRPKFGYSTEVINAILHELEQISVYVEINDDTLEVADDKDDNPILACAISAGVRYLITGDDDLLRLGEHGSIKIVPPSEFLSILNEE